MKMFAECTKKPVNNGMQDIENPPVNLSLCFSLQRAVSPVSVGNGYHSSVKEFPAIYFRSHAHVDRVVWLFNDEKDRDAEYNRLKAI